MPAKAAVRYTDFQTADHDLAVAAKVAAIPHRPRFARDDTGPVDFRLTSAAFGAFGVHAFRMRGLRYAALADPRDFLYAIRLVEGSSGFTGSGWATSLTGNGCFLVPPETAVRAEYASAVLHAVSVPLACARDMAEEFAGLRGRLLFEARPPVSDVMRRHWELTAAFVHRELTSAPELPSLLLVHLMRVAAASLLVTFPNSTMTLDYTPPSGRVAPAVVRRAAAYIEANAARPLTVADVASASGVGIRALQEAFRRHLDRTPMAYLRQVRLEAVRGELREAAERRAGETVKETARRWGFANPSRFAADYHAAFGELPSHTLRRR
ncbi:helix-turn-helix transcriptional regulator [Actinoplanes sp. NPDC051851]|uniref:helix-turn-helix transcriptional regulator n=1 Tax=Actinoplanes sp. NPDC051851 TaxID=3154753 RepID=UPI003424B86D